jgi:hypothetical protein
LGWYIIIGRCLEKAFSPREGRGEDLLVLQTPIAFSPGFRRKNPEGKCKISLTSVHYFNCRIISVIKLKAENNDRENFFSLIFSVEGKCAFSLSLTNFAF